jgi:DNA-binding HxlR family transcriptional regulator
MKSARSIKNLLFVAIQIGIIFARCYCNYFFWVAYAFIRVEERETVELPADRVTSGIDAFREAALHCPLPPAVELIGEKWAFLILRGALNGLQHFEEFQAGLNIARNILSDRLGKLVAGGILERNSDPLDRRKVVYSLTAKGEALLPVVLALRQWGQEWGYGEMQVVLADRRDGKPVRKICVQAQDGRELTLADLTWVKAGAKPIREAAG